MKNFTNKFKQVTSRLSARWLIMALMMLVGTSSAWGYNQSASKTLYFNASSSGLTMNSTYKLIYMVGHGSWSSAYPLKPVQYTKNMYTLSTVQWDGCTQVAFFQVKQSESWGDEGNSITHRKAYAQKSTNIHSLTSNISANVYFYGNLSRGNSTDYTDATNSYNITLTNKCDGVDNNEAGTIAVSRWNSTSSAYGTAYSSWLSNSNGSTKYLSALKVTATPKAGYKLKSLTVGGTSVSSGHEFEVTAATTIVATWELDCAKPAAPQLSVNKKINVCEGKDNTYGYIKIDNYASYSNCKFYLGSESNEITNNISEGLIGVNVPSSYKVIVKNDCGSTNEATIDFTATNDLTPAKPTFTVTGNSPICSGEQATLTANVTTSNTISSYAWTKSDGSAHGGTLSNDDKTLTTAPLTANTSYKVSVTLTNSGCPKTFDASNNPYTVTVKTKPTVPECNITNATSCKGTSNTNGVITMKETEPGVTYTLTDGKNNYTRRNNDFISLAAGTYTLTATLDDCPNLSDSKEIVLEATDVTPVIETLTMPADFSSCDGQLVNPGISLVNWNEEDGYTYTYQWQSSANGTSFTNMDGMTNSGMTPKLSGDTWYRVKVTKSKNGCTSPEATSGAVKVTALSVSTATVSISAASYNMNAGTFTVSGRLEHAGCSNDIYVGYRYKLSNDDTWSELINTHRLTEAGIFTKEGISIAGATAGQKYIFQTYAINGYLNYQESSAVLSSSTIEVEVQDGYTVYVRRPKSEDGTNVYTNWYELSSVKGGAPYVKSGAIQGSSANGQNKATTNNTGGTEMTYAFTDCDGYIWDSFKPAKGQTQFYIHALNDDAQNGWGTFSKTATIVADKDNYFYLSSWSSGQYGVNITSTDQPTRGVRIKVLGSNEVITTNMASFAAISFVGNCTGKELLLDADKVPTGFQWKYSANGTSWDNYDGEGATWNNIRPTAEGKYKLVCTMEDMTTVESNEVSISNKSVTYNATDLINIKSALPIIMVNTGDNNGFPACSVAGSDYPSKHADKFKKKLSVDVKIKVGNNIVYDKKARMAYRGSSSLNFKKKSYAFCPGADMCGLDEDKSPDFVKTKKIDMLSLITGGAKTSAKDKDWVLYAATPDPSMMRNILAMETFSAMTGKWGVKNQYVELYVDGEYQGVYVFMDKITQNKGRVNVEWKVDGSSKGFIVKFDKTDLADRYEIPNGDQKTFESAMKTGNTGVISYGTEIDQRFEIEYPEKEDVIDDGGSWADVYTFVKGKIDAFESALKDGDFNAVRTIIDYESWADFFILTEFAKNGDGYRASCVFVYEGGLLKAYPLWDYELSFDNETRQEHGIDKTTGLLVKQTTYNKVSGNDGTFPAPFWWTGNYYNQKTYKGLLDDPCFVAMVKARWTKHTTGDGALTKAKMQALVSAYNTALTTTDATSTYNTPQKREAYKWPYNGDTRGLTCNDKVIGYYGQGAGSAISKVETFTTSKTTLDAWIGDSGRRGGLSTEIENLAKDIKFAITVVADKATTTPWRPVTVTVNSNSGYEYSITPEPAKLEENGHIYTLYFARPERTEGQNFTTIKDAYTFTATTGQADQCGTTQGSTTSAEVKIDLADVVENCD